MAVNKTSASRTSASVIAGTSQIECPLYYGSSSFWNISGDFRTLWKLATGVQHWSITNSNATTYYIFLAPKTGYVALGHNMPSYDLSFSGQSTKIIGLEANTTDSSAGNNLSIKAGSATIQGEIITLSSVPTNGGTGYIVGDVLTITTGSGTAQCQVETASTGVITSLKLIRNGSGYTVASAQATSGGTGSSCTVNITAVRTAGSNKNGGIIVISPGESTGTGFASIIYQRNSGGSTGTTKNTLSDAAIIPSSKICADNTLTTLFNIACAIGTSTGCEISYTIKTISGAGNESHTETGKVILAAATDGSATTTSIVKAYSTQLLTDAGSYTVTFAASAANPTVISVTADSTLDVSSLISYNIINVDNQTVTQL